MAEAARAAGVARESRHVHHSARIGPGGASARSSAKTSAMQSAIPPMVKPIRRVFVVPPRKRRRRIETLGDQGAESGAITSQPGQAGLTAPTACRRIVDPLHEGCHQRIGGARTRAIAITRPGVGRPPVLEHRGESLQRLVADAASGPARPGVGTARGSRAAARGVALEELAGERADSGAQTGRVGPAIRCHGPCGRRLVIGCGQQEQPAQEDVAAVRVR